MGIINQTYLFEIPVANAVRFTKNGEVNNQRANFDQVRFSQAEHTTIQPRLFFQPFETSDTIRIEFYSNYPLNRIRVIDCDEQQQSTGEPSLAVAYRNKKYRSQCKFTSYDGKLFIYFDEGFEFTDEDFEEQGDFVVLDGRLPTGVNAVPGALLRFQIQELGIQSAVIGQVIWNAEVGAEGYLIDLSSALVGSVDGVVEVTYHEKDADLYSYEVPISSLEDGVYYIEVAYGVTDYTNVFLSEPLNIADSHPDTLAVDYRHNGTYDSEDQFAYVYLSDWLNRIRVPANHHEFEPSGQIETYEDDYGTPRILRAVPYRQVTFRAFNIPSWLIDKFNLVFGHDTLIINEYYWQCEDFGQYSRVQRTDIGDFEIHLKQVNDRNLVTNSEAIEISAEFDPDAISDISFEGDGVQAEFTSDVPDTFYFASLPAWITPDQETFSDGDTITFTLSENTGLFNRSIQLVAISDTVPGLTATITLTQLYNTEQELFIDVDDYDVDFPAAGDDIVINVNSSGDYDITGQGVFTVEKENGFTQIRITAAENTDPDEKTATIKLALQADAGIFVEIAVSQTAPQTISSVDPDNIEVSILNFEGDSFEVEVTTLAGIRWSYIVNGSHEYFVLNGDPIWTGTRTIQFFVVGQIDHPAGSFDESITFYDIDNPGNEVTLIITLNYGSA